jgi:hypothetical protein
MPYKVTSPLVIVPNADGKSSDGYFYENAVIPDGFNDERCEELVKDGMLEKARADAGSGDSTKEPTVKEILDEVGDDKEKAAEALAAEQEARGDKARKTLVEPLQAVIDA